MGVVGLWSAIEACGRQIAVHSLRGVSLAVDGSIWMTSSAAAFNKLNGKLDTEARPYLRTLFWKLVFYTKIGVKLIVVFDGIPPELKRATLDARRPPISLSATSPAARLHFLNSNSRFATMCHEFMELLVHFGIPCVLSPCEAEAMCAALEANQLVSGCLTNDGDAFLFGARNVYRDEDLRNQHIALYSMDRIERERGLGRRELIALALLLGCDYTRGWNPRDRNSASAVHGVGPRRALAFIRACVSRVNGKDALDLVLEWSGTDSHTSLNESDVHLCPSSMENSSLSPNRSSTVLRDRDSKRPQHCSLCGHLGTKIAHSRGATLSRTAAFDSGSLAKSSPVAREQISDSIEDAANLNERKAATEGGCAQPGCACDGVTATRASKNVLPCSCDWHRASRGEKRIEGSGEAGAGERPELDENGEAGAGGRPELDENGARADSSAVLAKADAPLKTAFHFVRRALAAAARQFADMNAPNVIILAPAAEPPASSSSFLSQSRGSQSERGGEGAAQPCLSSLFRAVAAEFLTGDNATATAAAAATVEGELVTAIATLGRETAGAGWSCNASDGRAAIQQRQQRQLVLPCAPAIAALMAKRCGMGRERTLAEIRRVQVRQQLLFDDSRHTSSCSGGGESEHHDTAESLLSHRPLPLLPVHTSQSPPWTGETATSIAGFNVPPFSPCPPCTWGLVTAPIPAGAPGSRGAGAGGVAAPARVSTVVAAHLCSYRFRAVRVVRERLIAGRSMLTVLWRRERCFCALPQQQQPGPRGAAWAGASSYSDDHSGCWGGGDDAGCACNCGCGAPSASPSRLQSPMSQSTVAAVETGDSAGGGRVVFDLADSSFSSSPGRHGGVSSNSGHSPAARGGRGGGGGAVRWDRASAPGGGEGAGAGELGCVVESEEDAALVGRLAPAPVAAWRAARAAAAESCAQQRAAAAASRAAEKIAARAAARAAAAAERARSAAARREERRASEERRRSFNRAALGVRVVAAATPSEKQGLRRQQGQPPLLLQQEERAAADTLGHGAVVVGDVGARHSPLAVVVERSVQPPRPRQAGLPPPPQRQLAKSGSRGVIQLDKTGSRGRVQLDITRYFKVVASPAAVRAAPHPQPPPQCAASPLSPASLRVSTSAPAAFGIPQHQQLGGQGCGPLEVEGARFCSSLSGASRASQCGGGGVGGGGGAKSIISGSSSEDGEEDEGVGSSAGLVAAPYASQQQPRLLQWKPRKRRQQRILAPRRSQSLTPRPAPLDGAVAHEEGGEEASEEWSPPKLEASWSASCSRCAQSCADASQHGIDISRGMQRVDAEQEGCRGIGALLPSEDDSDQFLSSQDVLLAAESLERAFFAANGGLGRGLGLGGSQAI